MMYAYDENLLNKAQITLANMLDTAVNTYGYDLKDFYFMFLNSTYSKRFERGESSVVAGMSGRELAYVVISEKENIKMKDMTFNIDRSIEYWIGWSLAFYQWYTNKRFNYINEIADMDVLVSIYPTFHEMDIMHFVEFINDRENKNKALTFKRLRTYAGLSQKELADMTGIPLRTIQQYEQGQKELSHARADSVVKLAKALYCDVADII